MDIDNDLSLVLPPPSRSALDYAERGWQVLPLWWPAPSGGCACGLPGCGSAGKHPVSDLVPHGLHDASSQLDTVSDWWRVVPDANVGIRTGAGSGLVVLDVDGPAGRRALHDLVGARSVFPARWVQTGGDGWHGYLAHPGTIAVPSSAGRLGEGLDVRGDGGYVVAPPSRHPSRRLYRWIHPWIHPRQDLGRLPAMPAWLIELAAPQPRAEPQPVRLLSADVATYGPAALEREAREVARARPGQRNHRLNRAAFKLGQLVAAGLLEEADAVAALVAAGLAAGPGERKIRATVRRGLLAGMRHRRQVVSQTPR